MTIGNSVTTIGGFAFSGCTGLTSVTIPNSVTYIVYGVFSSCSSDLVLSVGADSYAHQYAKDNSIPYIIFQSGWQKISGKWYWFESGGAMATGWKKLDGKWYYFESSGVMLANTDKTINCKTYHFDQNGVCTNP